MRPQLSIAARSQWVQSDGEALRRRDVKDNHKFLYDITIYKAINENCELQCHKVMAC